MKLRNFVFILLSGLLLNSCIDDIKLDIDNAQQQLTVDGLIADSLQEYSIKVSYSAVIGIGTDDLETPVEGATVRVLDDAGGSFEFAETKAGTYTRFMQGEVGKAYHVEVKMPDGKIVLSRPAVLKKAPKLLPPNFNVTEEATLSGTGRPIYTKKLAVGMNADVSELTEPPFLRWRATGEYEFGEDYPGIIDRKICYAKNNIDFNNIKIFDTNKLSDGLLFKEPFLNMSYDYRFYYMYCFHLFQYSTSEEEYKYWENVRDIVNIDGSLFDPPPGTVTGNLYNPADLEDQVLGYFSVAGVYYRQHFVNATDLGNSAPPKCGNWPPQQPAECFNCLLLANSTANRPAYWKP
jgi:Domain of unknown function (DUF4249)